MAEETQVADPKAAFAGLMSGAAKAAQPDSDPEAPYGWTTDPQTGEKRPKLAAGRPRKSPGIDELRASREAAPADNDSPAGRDSAPARPGRRKKDRSASSSDPEPVIQHRPGVITKGVNRLYRKAGKIVQVMDPDIGRAIIESTRNTAEDGESDDSVGAAWDELARTNPRIRRFLLKAIAGGAWGQLIMAHAPILLAVLMKDSVSRHIPFFKLMQAFLSDDGAFDVDTSSASDVTPEPARPGSLRDLMGNLSPDDMQQMMGLAQQMMAGQAAAVADATAGPAGDATPPPAPPARMARPPGPSQFVTPPEKVPAAFARHGAR
jgi:hypothetical protein